MQAALLRCEMPLLCCPEDLQALSTVNHATCRIKKSPENRMSMLQVHRYSAWIYLWLLGRHISTVQGERLGGACLLGLTSGR